MENEETPRLVLGQQDLEDIRAMLTKYLAYLRREPGSPRLERHRARVEQVRAKMDALYTASIGSQASLTAEDLAALVETLKNYAILVRRVVPPSLERGNILQGIKLLLRDIDERLS